MVPKLPMSLIQAPGGAGLFSPLSFPLFWALKHGPWKNESGGWGLAIMWLPFVRKKQQPTELCVTIDDEEEENDDGSRGRRIDQIEIDVVAVVARRRCRAGR